MLLIVCKMQEDSVILPTEIWCLTTKDGGHRNTITMECTVCTVTYPDTCTFICAYRYHRTPHADFLADLNQVIHDIKAKKLVVAGDMNLNMRNESVKHNIKTKILSPNKLTQIETGPTTKTGSISDHIYTNVDGITANVIPTYYSDHDLIVMNVI